MMYFGRPDSYGLVKSEQIITRHYAPTVEALEAAKEALESLGRLVNAQAKDRGLWFITKTAPEGYLQGELRRLHCTVEKSARAALAHIEKVMNDPA